MDDKPIYGFLLFLVIGCGMVTTLTTTHNLDQALFGNLVGIGIVVGLLQIPRVKDAATGLDWRNLAVLIGLLGLAATLAFTLGRWAIQF
jgi:hypothetical protein